MEKTELLQEQLELEDEAYNISKYKANTNFLSRLEKGQGSETSEAIVFIKKTIEPVSEKLTEYFEAPIRGKQYYIRELVGQYRKHPDNLAYLVLSGIFNTLLATSVKLKGEPYTAPLTTVARSVLSNIKKDYQLDVIKSQAPKLDKYIDYQYKRLSIQKRLQKKLRIATDILDFDRPDNKDIIPLAVNLIDCVIKSNAGLVRTKNIKFKNKKRTMLTFTPMVIDLLNDMRDLSPLLSLVHEPLIIEPKPWENFRGTGGYYSGYFKCDVVKMHHDKKNRELVINYFNNNIDFRERYLNIINSIQQTPWKVNTRVLDVLDAIYREHIVDHTKEYHLIADLPDDDLPPIDEVYPDVEWDDNKPEKYRENKRLRDKLEVKFNTLRSKNIVNKLALAMAKKYRNYDKIYFSYQVDFRGRLYPIQSHLSPQGTKVVKSLLMFAEGKPINTPEAYKWFMIHGANCYGYDKLLYDERIKKMEEFKDEATEIVRNPLVNIQWTEADNPFGFLAWCFEYVDYISNPERFVSHIPIALDATCSGIQIYSGLMLDRKGAEAVNVVSDNTRIADIYGDVANCVNRYLETDNYEKTFSYKTADGVSHTIEMGDMASDMVGKIDRKVTKRNVMTFPYNVSQFGMRDQLMDEILTEYENTPKQFWNNKYKHWQVAAFLANLNYKGIGEVVKGAVRARDFLKDITKDTVTDEKFIKYPTPIFNFPVIHRIVKYKTHRVTTALAKLSIKVPTTSLDSKRMVNGIAPNYIHSLDATLMFRTVERLLDKGVKNFALIHDSYGTHAADSELLHKEVKNAYIELFKDKPLLKFVEQVAPTRLQEAEELLVDDLDLNEVSKSDYIFS